MDFRFVTSSTREIRIPLGIDSQPGQSNRVCVFGITVCVRRREATDMYLSVQAAGMDAMGRSYYRQLQIFSPGDLPSGRPFLILKLPFADVSAGNQAEADSALVVAADPRDAGRPRHGAKPARTCRTRASCRRGGRSGALNIAEGFYSAVRLPLPTAAIVEANHAAGCAPSRRLRYRSRRQRTLSRIEANSCEQPRSGHGRAGCLTGRPETGTASVPHRKGAVR